jgi:hypothetical protein
MWIGFRSFGWKLLEKLITGYTKYVPFSPTIVPAISLYYNSKYTSFNPHAMPWKTFRFDLYWLSCPCHFNPLQHTPPVLSFNGFFICIVTTRLYGKVRSLTAIENWLTKPLVMGGYYATKPTFVMLGLWSII